MGCSFTGHRVIPTQHLNAVIALLHREIAYAYEQGCRDFYCGGALGFDTLAAECVLSLKDRFRDIRLVMLLPCVDQDRMWNAAQRARYKRILSLADEVAYVCREYNDGCMRLRNMELVKSCRILIAYSGRVRSGAAQTVRMAEREGKIVRNIYPLLNEIST